MRTRILLGVLLVALVAAATGCATVGPHGGLPVANNLPPAERLMHPGPGVTGPGPGVIPAAAAFGVPEAPPGEIQILFNKPEGMQLRWDVSGVGQYDSDPLIVPGRTNFAQGGIYRLKLTNIPGRVGVELYPTLEVGPTTPRTAAYLAHNAVPIQYTEEDWDQVLAGNYVTKVIYLPDPEFQQLALAGVETLVSTRLDPGVDPIVEADRRGAILAIVRLGNKDMEVPGADGAEVISPAAYMHGGGPMSMGPMPYHSSGLMPNYISGVTAPHWGMPMTGTPIGLPGPPHIPLGGPAGLQQHVMQNHTHMHLPGPVDTLRMHVQQSPGFSYPAPANTAFVHERVSAPLHQNKMPPREMRYRRSMHQHGPGCGCAACQSAGY